MWNYVTYRDAIALVGLDADDLYPEGTTRLPADWADLGWLTCFHGPPASAPGGDARRGRARRARRLPARPDRAAARRGGARARPRARRQLRGRRHRGRPGRPRARAAGRRSTPATRSSSATPATSTCPPAVLAAGGVPGDRRRSAPSSGYRLDPDAVAAAITPRTRAICLVDPSNPYGTAGRAPTRSRRSTALAERHGLLLIHDVTHGLLAIEPGAPPVAAPAPAEHAVATFSVSHCFGHGRRAHGLPGRAARPSCAAACSSRPRSRG